MTAVPIGHDRFDVVFGRIRRHRCPLERRAVVAGSASPDLVLTARREGVDPGIVRCRDADERRTVRNQCAGPD